MNFLKRQLRLNHDEAKQLAPEEQKLVFDWEQFLAEEQDREAQIAIWKGISNIHNVQTSLVLELIKEIKSDLTLYRHQHQDQ